MRLTVRMHKQCAVVKVRLWLSLMYVTLAEKMVECSMPCFRTPLCGVSRKKLLLLGEEGDERLVCTLTHIYFLHVLYRKLFPKPAHPSTLAADMSDLEIEGVTTQTSIIFGKVYVLLRSSELTIKLLMK